MTLDVWLFIGILVAVLALGLWEHHQIKKNYPDDD